MTEALDTLRQVVNRISPLSDEVWTQFAAIWLPFSAKRKSVLTSSGEKENFLYFVLGGVQRVYYFDEKGREATVVFTYSPSFGGVLDSIMLGTSSKYCYECLSNSVFLRASVQDLNELIGREHSVETLIRLGVAGSLEGVLERLVELQCFSAEERFIKLFNRSPHILQLVPHKYIANYLGMDATNFSKLLNRLRI